MNHTRRSWVTDYISQCYSRLPSCNHYNYYLICKIMNLKRIRAKSAASLCHKLSYEWTFFYNILVPAECKIPRFVQFLGKESAAETNKTPGELPGFNKNKPFFWLWTSFYWMLFYIYFKWYHNSEWVDTFL